MRPQLSIAPASRMRTFHLANLATICVALMVVGSFLPGVCGFSNMGQGLLASRGLELRVGRTVRSGRSAVLGASMVYTPPRRQDVDSSFFTPERLDEMKEALDRAVRIPSPKSRDSPKVVVPRSPCTSLYGNWRPTTGTENWRSASGRTITKKPTKSANDELDVAVKTPAVRGRPPSVSKTAVKDELLPEFVARAAKVLMLNDGRMDSNLFGQQWKMLHRSAPLSTFKCHKAVAVHQMMRENEQFFTVGETDRHKVKMFEMKEDKITAYLSEFGLSVGVTSIEDEKKLVKLRDGVPANSNLEFEDEEEEEELGNGEGTSKYVSQPSSPQNINNAMYSAVPMQGKARNTASFDRRRRVTARPQQTESIASVEQETAAVAPRHLASDGCRSAAVSMYNGWAVDGRDVVMEVSNEPPLANTLRETVMGIIEAKPDLRAVDVGCGNGWAARLTKQLAPQAHVTAMDAASLMVKRAHELDPEGLAEYVIGDAGSWAPAGGKGVDLVLAVELLHLVDNPKALLERMAGWLQPGGKLIVTLECYKENRLSSSWSADLGVPMTLLAEKKWVSMVENAGLVDVTSKRSMPAGSWQGMLVIEATKA